MNTEANKQLAIDLFARFTARDIPGVLDRLADDATWWIAGKPEQMRTAGPHDKAGIARLFQAMDSRLKDGLKMTVKNAIAEGDQVALELESIGELTNGRRYNNQYHMLMTMRDGKVAAVKEYLDTHHAWAVWFGE